MRNLRSLFLPAIAVAVIFPQSARPATLPEITAPDTRALDRAMAAVGPDDSRVIHLAGGRYAIEGGASICDPGGSALPPVQGDITIMGHGSTLEGVNGGRLPFCTAASGTLVLQDLTIQGFAATIAQENFISVAYNRGRLRLEGVTVRRNGLLRNPRQVHTILNENGRLEIVRSAFVGNLAAGRSQGTIIRNFPPHEAVELVVRDSVFTRNRIRGDTEGSAAVISTADATEMMNVVVSDNTHGVTARGGFVASHLTITGNGFGVRKPTGEDELTTIRNSVIALNESGDCDARSPINFEGINLDSDGSCGLDQDIDLTSTDPSLEPAVLLGTGLPGVQPTSSSPVLDRADPGFCPLRDAVGRIRNTADDDDPRCALGAVEPPNEPPGFEIDARLTGTWYDPGHDGHYVSFQVLPIDLVAATWWTYDNEGNPYWLVGSGQVQGDSATVDVYASRGMTLPGLDDDDREQVLWGTLELEFQDCDTMRLRWRTDRPGFSDGEATMTRLTTIEGLEC